MATALLTTTSRLIPSMLARLPLRVKSPPRETYKENFPIPVIEDPLAKIGKAQWFSTLDLMSGYYQISVREGGPSQDSLCDTVWKIPINVMPFGLTNAPSTFCRYMSTVSGDLDFVAVYLDDILIFSKTERGALQPCPYGRLYANDNRKPN